MVEVNLEELTRKLQDRFTDMLFATIEEYMPPKTKQANPALPPEPMGLEGKFGDLIGLVDFTDGLTMQTVKFKGWVNKDDFAKVAQVVKGLGGKYVSAGKNSHFEILKTAKP